MQSLVPLLKSLTMDMTTARLAENLHNPQQSTWPCHKVKGTTTYWTQVKKLYGLKSRLCYDMTHSEVENKIRRRVMSIGVY
jgi:hypothetical protein